MTDFAEINELVAAGQVTNFRLATYDGHRLTVVGSFDLTYYHDVELIFTDVCRINSPVEFHWPEFSDAGVCSCCDGQRFSIRTDDGQFEIVAQTVEVVIGKVYYYDRGNDLQPGERIADRVTKNAGADAAM